MATLEHRTNTLNPAAELIAQLCALRVPTSLVEVPVGTAFDTCDHSSDHDRVDFADRATVVTLYGSETTLDVCLACALGALGSFHVDTGNDPEHTRVEVSELAQAQPVSAASWSHPARLTTVIDNDGSELSVDLCDSVFTGPLVRVGTWESALHFDPATAHGRAALTAIRDALNVALGGVS